MKNVRQKLMSLALAGGIAIGSLGAGAVVTPAAAWSPVVNTQCPRGVAPWVPGWLHMKWCTQSTLFYIHCKSGGESPYSHC